MNEQDDESQVITCILEHNHPNTERNFYCSKNRRKLSKNGENFVLDLIGAKASNRNIAEVLTQRIGKPYNTQDVRNIFTHLKSTNKEILTLEESLKHMNYGGGNVRYKKMDRTDNVGALWILNTFSI